jgi:hypothetical protein
MNYNNLYAICLFTLALQYVIHLSSVRQHPSWLGALSLYITRISHLTWGTLCYKNISSDLEYSLLQEYLIGPGVFSVTRISHRTWGTLCYKNIPYNFGYSVTIISLFTWGTLCYKNISSDLGYSLFYLFCSSIVINTVIVTAGNFEP